MSGWIGGTLLLLHGLVSLLTAPAPRGRLASEEEDKINLEGFTRTHTTTHPHIHQTCKVAPRGGGGLYGQCSDVSCLVL